MSMIAAKTFQLDMGKKRKDSTVNDRNTYMNSNNNEQVPILKTAD